MIQGYRKGRYEFFVVMIALSVILLVAFDRYQKLATSARNLGFEVISHHFMKGAADARVQWLLQSRTGAFTDRYEYPLPIGEQKIYFSPQAWPASTQGLVTDKFQPSVDDCYGLWQALLQNPAPISKEGEHLFGSRQYHVRVYEKACRYLLVDEDKRGTYYFDYYPLEGKIILSIPDKTNFEN